MEDVFASLREMEWDDYIPPEDIISVPPPMCDEIKRAISQAMTGRKLSAETKRKMSEFHKGNTYWLGKKLTEEHKKNCAKAKYGNTWNCKTFKITYEDGRKEIVSGLRKFCRDNNYSSGCLADVNKGRRRKHKDIVAVEEVSLTP